MAVTAAYYVTFSRNVYYHEYAYYHTLFRDLYFLPLILAAVWFGLAGALVTSFGISILYVPFIVMNWQGLSPADFNRILEILLFNAVAAVLGLVSAREKARQKALRDAESLAAMGRAVAALAHDMRNPLTAIGGFTRVVSKRLAADEEGRAKLDLVIKESDRLEAMVRDMLDFSRPLRLTLEQGDINRYIGQALLLLEDQAGKKGVRIETELAADLPPIDFDPARMEQVFTNLLSNALDASPEGETVAVRTYRAGRTVFLDVADHGPGIPREHGERIFTPFFTTKSRGTGLGLAIVSKIVDAHNGKIEALDNPKGGAIFRVSLYGRG